MFHMCNAVILFSIVLFVSLSDDIHKVTPLLMAAICNRLEIAELLVMYNCNLDVVGRFKVNKNFVQMSPFQCALERGHCDIVKLLVASGCDLSKETYLWTNVDVPDCLVLNLELWVWIKEMLSEPLSLKEMCRRKIRKILGYEIRSKLEETGLPGPIRAFLL